MEFSYRLRGVAADDITFSGPGLGSSANCFIADYSPFGVQLDCLSRIFIGRRTITSDKYRYGFQGQETDDEIKGEGNSVNYKYRMHDPRIGRFFAIDPLTAKYPHYTPYSFSGNKVINAIELEGLEELYIYDKWGEFQEKVVITNMTSDEIESLVGKYGLNWDSDWWNVNRNIYDKWYIEGSVDFWNRSCGTTICKHSPDGKSYFSESDKRFSEWFFSVGDGSEWEGHDNLTNTGDISFEQGIKIMGGTVAVVLTGGTIALAGELSILSAVSLVSGVDDMTTQKDGSTLLSNTTGISTETLDKLKLGVSIASFTKGTQGLIKNFADASKTSNPWTNEQVMDMMNVINDEITAVTSGASMLNENGN